MRIETFTLRHVEFMPRELEPGILFVSQRFGVAGHLCACGCGNKVMTPLREMEWSLSELNGRPTLDPSIGNWQLACRSHYVIADGEVLWMPAWSQARVDAGRAREIARREAYFAARTEPWWVRLWRWLLSLVDRK